MVKLWARIADRNYLIACSDDEAARQDKFWSDYYSDEEGNVETIEIQVPQNMVQDLLSQGSRNQVYSDGYEAFSDILKRGRIQEKGGKLIKVKKDIAINDNHILEAGDLLKINAVPDSKNSLKFFTLTDPVVIGDMYLDAGDTITVMSSSNTNKVDDEKKDKKNSDKKDDFDADSDKEDDEKIDVEIKEQVIIGQYVFEVGDKIKIIPHNKNSSVSRMNERTFRTNKNLNINGTSIKKGSLIEIMKEEKKPEMMMGEKNILKEGWI